MLRRAFGDVVDAEIAFAWKSFLFDTSNNDVFGLKEKRPG